MAEYMRKMEGEVLDKVGRLEEVGWEKYQVGGSRGSESGCGAGCTTSKVLIVKKANYAITAPGNLPPNVQHRFSELTPTPP
jgi:cellobiose-specific phosphotransferase system component IIC